MSVSVQKTIRALDYLTPSEKAALLAADPERR
jgi:hypothetical protein